jgi:hypothetical protein
MGGSYIKEKSMKANKNKENIFMSDILDQVKVMDHLKQGEDRSKMHTDILKLLKQFNSMSGKSPLSLKDCRQLLQYQQVDSKTKRK